MSKHTKSNQSTPSNLSGADMNELFRKVSELYSDYEWRQMFDKAQERKRQNGCGEDKIAKIVSRMEEKSSYENVRGEVIEHLSILEAIAEGIMAAKENEQSITEGTARGLLWEFEKFAAAVYGLIEKADEIVDF